jgi:hypothetical protein
MAATDRDSLGLKLSIQVIGKEVSFDEALMKAHSGGAVREYINSLNTMAGGDFFHLAEAETRLRSGDAQRAVEGQVPLLDLPPELAESTSGEDGFGRDRIEAELGEINSTIAELQSQLEDDTRWLDLIRAAEKNLPKAPKPWLGSSVLFAMTTVICVIILLAMKSLIGTLLVFVAGTGLASVLFVNEMTKYRRFVEKANKDYNARMEKMRLAEEAIREGKKGIAELRERGEERLKKVSHSSPEDKAEIVASFPQVFPSKTDGQTERE